MHLRRLYLSRLARDNPLRTYHRQKSRKYWLQRNRLQRAKFWINKNIYGTRRWANSQLESASNLAFILKKVILRTVVGQLLFAVVLVTGLEVLERTVLPWLAGLGVAAGLPGMDITPSKNPHPVSGMQAYITYSSSG